MQSSRSIPSAIPGRRLCLFGGSFDPVHLGHVAVAERAWSGCGLEKVIFLPAWRSPHKPGDRPAAGADRLAMLALALAGRDWAEVNGWELERRRPSYSWQAAEHFAGVCGAGVELCWLLGADQWARLDTWARPERLAALLTFLVFPRDGVLIEPRVGVRHEVVDFRHPASSTAVRAAVRGGGSMEGLVDPAVAAYIREHRLYR